MTRFMLGGFILALAISASADDKKDVPKELAPFQGKWKVVEVSFGGEPLPKDKLEGLGLTFESKKMTTLENGREKTGTYSVDPKKNPATIDMIGPKGEVGRGIYKFSKDGKLTICFKKGEEATRPKDFDDKEAALVVLEKVKE